ncbi:ABC transporter permease, partial [Bacteroides sp. CAG:633]|uniref:ABC transporter permease n=1 Tax=Bacteroides sp. CAG:633 TaxID=1262744 RepID=UPI000A7931F4
SLLVLWGIEVTDGRMDYSIEFMSMTFSKSLLMCHAAQYIGLLVLLCAGICLVTTLRIRRISVQDGLNGGLRRCQSHRGRNFMLGVQFFLCWLFVALSAALYLQSEKTSGTLLHTLSMQEKASILSIPLDYSFLNNAEKQSLVGRFKSLAAVEDALLADVSYLGGSSGNLMMTEKGNDNSWIEVEVMRVPANFFSFMNILLEQGRAPKTEADIVADRTWQQRMEKDILGMPLYDSQHDYSVCGICAPFQTDTYRKSIGYVFLPYDVSDYIGHCYLKCHSGRVQEVKARVEQLLREALPESVPVRVGTLLDDIHDRQPLEYTLKNIVLFFAIVSILITLLGVYSSITLDTERRQKEVAIRKVNGAGVPQIMLLFARLYIVLLAVSALLSFPLVWFLLQQWKRMYIVFFDHGFLFWTSIFVLVAVVTALTVVFRILRTA